jgi:hypothetical protein
VHNRHEQIFDLIELEVGPRQFSEFIRQGIKVELVVVGFLSGDLNLLLELGEWASICRLILLEELKHLLDTLTVELLADVVQVVRLVPPELQLNERVRVLVALKRRLWILLEDVLDLPGPVCDGLLKLSSLIFGR